jgi:hypothetical protein
MLCLEVHGRCAAVGGERMLEWKVCRNSYAKAIFPPILDDNYIHYSLALRRPGPIWPSGLEAHGGAENMENRMLT